MIYIKKTISVILSALLAMQPLYALAETTNFDDLITDNVTINEQAIRFSAIEETGLENEIYKSVDFSDMPADAVVNDKALVAIEGVTGDHRYVLGVDEGGEAELLGDASRLSVWDGTTVDTDWYLDPTKTTFTLRNAAEFAGFASLVSNSGVTFEGKTVELITDIDINNNNWLPIGRYDSDNAVTYRPFLGTFNGNGHVIKNLRIGQAYDGGIGLFGSLGAGAVVKNLGCEDFTFSYSNLDNKPRVDHTGAIAGYTVGATIDSCYVKNFSTANWNKWLGEGQAAGMVGRMGQSSVIRNSYLMNITIIGSPNAYHSEFAGRLDHYSKYENCYTAGTFCSYACDAINGDNTPVYVTGGVNWASGVGFSNTYFAHTLSIESAPPVENHLSIPVITDDEIKSGNIAIGDKFVQRPGEYPAHNFYRSNKEKYIEFAFLANENIETTFTVLAQDGADSFKITLADNKINAGSHSADVVLNDWNKIEIFADYNTSSAKVLLNGTEIGTVSANGTAYGALKISQTTGKILVDDMVFGNDYTAESKALEALLDAEMDNIGLNPFTASELPTMVDGYKVEWKSSDDTIISDDGLTVNKKPYGQNVTLTGSVVLNGYKIEKNPSFTKAYTAYVPPLDGVTDAERANAIADQINVTDENENFITKSLKNVVTEFDGCTITWTSTNEDVITTSGVVTRPETDNETVTLTATVDCNGETAERVFNFTVISTDNLLSEAMAELDYDDLTSEDNTKLKTDLTLPKSGAYGVSIDWATSNDSLITEDGYVTRSDNNETVTLTATYELDGRTVTEEFYFNVLLAASVMLEQDINAFNFTKTEATEDFTVPLRGTIHGSIINWTSDNGAISISNTTGEATVTRPESNEPNAECTLTVKFIQGDDIETRTFTVTVPRNKSDAELVAECKEFITWDEINVCQDHDVRENFTLPLVYDGGVTCTWSTSDENVVTAEGVVIRPAVGEPDAEATLTVTITKGSASDTDSFTFYVSAFDEAAQVLDKASKELNFRAISSEPINMVSADLNLMTSWRYGTTIEWTSSDETLVATDGTVTRPAFGSGAADITLTAKIKYGDAEPVIKTFIIGLVSEGSAVSALYRDFEADEYGDVIGSEFKYTKPYDVFKVVDNPTKSVANNSDKVAMYMREGGENGISQYEPQIYPSESRGEFDISFDFYIDELPEYVFQIRAYTFNAFLIDVDNTGKIRMRGKNYATWTSGVNALPVKQWNNFRLHIDTLREKQILYINNVAVFGQELDLISSQDSQGNIGKLAFRFDGNDLTQDHRVYFDNMKITRTVDYTQFLASAYEQFERGFIAAQNINAITDNLIIPDISVFETDITCTSSNTEVVADDGTVTRPEVDTPVQFTATFSNRWGGSKSRTFNLVVKATEYEGDTGSGNLSDADSVLSDVVYVDNYVKSNNILNGATSNLVLPAVGENGSTVTWSSNSSIVSNTGVVTRPANDTTVILTAVISKGNVSEIVNIPVTVKAKSIIIQPSNPGSSSGSISGISGGIPGGTVTAPTVTPEPQTPTATSKYSDVAKSHWANEAVEALSDKGIINGFDDGTFAPNSSVKREEFAKMIAIVGGYDTDTDVESVFSDAPQDAWYVPFINAVYENGVVSGIGDGKFGVGMNITRQDMCVMMYNVLKSLTTLPEAKDNSFKDGEDIADYAEEAINVLSAAGVINGDDDGNCNPKSSATRAEAAQMLYNALELLK